MRCLYKQGVTSVGLLVGFGQFCERIKTVVAQMLLEPLVSTTPWQSIKRNAILEMKRKNMTLPSFSGCF